MSSAMKAIREKCLSCCCDQPGEVKHCEIEKCPLHPFRAGHRPKVEGKAKRTLSPEHLAKLQAARQKRQKSK